jgi:DNA processing protein
VIEAERLARVRLSAAVEPGHADVLRAVAESSAQAVLDRLRRGDPRLDRDGRLGRRVLAVDAAALLTLAERYGISVTIPGDPTWPPGLDDLAGCVRDRRGEVPVCLWARGSASPLLLQRSAALVGSRAATAYGTAVAGDWAAVLADRGVAVVSGAAYGVDAAAHRGALAVGGVTVAVLAGGLDQPYPRGNATLLDRIAADGLLLSEAAPGSVVNRGRFLSRNRLIAALARGTVVVEAGRRSGALSTAAWAAALLRPVAGVPGPVTSATSVGPMRLVRDQVAVLVTTPEEVVELVGDFGADLAPLSAAPSRATDGLPEPLLVVREAMPSRSPMTVAELVAATGYDLPTVLRALDGLAERGLVAGHGETWRVRAPRRVDA